MVLEIANNAFIGNRCSVLDENEGKDALYHLHIFRQYAEQWVDPCLDQGPFVLVHGDLEPFNLIVDEHMSVICVLDWEWSRVVPRQFFIPPLWLGIPDTTKLAYDFVYEDYLKYFDQLLVAVRSCERQRFGDEQLADDWAAAKQDSGFLVANALENWTDMDWFAHRYINWKWYGCKEDLSIRIKEFMDQDPTRGALIAKKLRDGRAHSAELDHIKGIHNKFTLLYTIVQHFSPRQILKDAVSRFPILAKLAPGGVAVILVGASYLLVQRITRSHLPR